MERVFGDLGFGVWNGATLALVLHFGDDGILRTFPLLSFMLSCIMYILVILHCSQLFIFILLLICELIGGGKVWSFIKKIEVCFIIGSIVHYWISGGEIGVYQYIHGNSGHHDAREYSRTHCT